MIGNIMQSDGFLFNFIMQKLMCLFKLSVKRFDDRMLWLADNK